MAEPPVSREPGTHFVIVPHTHWDREWYRPFEDFRRRLVGLVDRLLDVLDSTPDFRCFHFDGQTITLDDYAAIRPRQVPRLRAHLAAGRIHVGPWRVLPDEFLVTGEALIRNLQQGHGDCARWGAAPLPVGYTPDQFGHVGVLPQILAGFGLEAGVVWRGVGPDVTRTQFLWEAPDGTRLFTIYLPGGYGNGASLPERVEPLLERLDQIREEQAPFCAIPPLLVMNGSDHLEPQARLPTLLAAAFAHRPDWSFEIAGLPAFVAQARAAAAELPVHAGEFRHPWRANLLPGVTSVRAYQKQTDFRVCRLFEKYVEPMSAWAERLGALTGAQDFIDYAWRLIVENHPHDSICGCSVDDVHEEMDARWMKVLQVGSALERDALHALGGACRTAALGDDVGQALVTYTAARPAVQAMEIDLYLDEPETVASLRDRQGRHHAIQVRPQAPEVFFETRMPAAMLQVTVAGMEGREILGYYMNNVLVDRDGDDLTVTVICGHRPYGEVDVEAQRRAVLEALAAAGDQPVHVIGRSATRTRVRAVLPVAGQTGLDAFALSPAAPHDTSWMLQVGEGHLETEAVRVEVRPDGSLRLHDKRTGRRWERVLRFVDEGDRGDTYNFDPVAGGVIVDRPVAPPVTSVLADGPVAATLAVDLVYRLPAALADDRQRRRAECVEMPLRLEVTCYRELARIDVRVTVENAARDHRLRAEIDLPFAPEESIAEGPFGVVRRPVALPDTPATVERYYGTAPTKGFVCVQDAGGGIALVTRGLQEYDVMETDDGGALALTLLRCVGWLSRDDLDMRNRNSAGPSLETPGAQALGCHTFEFALLPYAGDYAAAGVPAQAHGYIFPPLGVRTGRHAGPVEPGTQLLRTASPHVVASAVTLSDDRTDLVVRVYNEAEAPVDAAVTFADVGERIQAIDLRERPRDGAGERVEGRSVQVRMTPSQICTWRLRRSRAPA